MKDIFWHPFLIWSIALLITGLTLLAMWTPGSEFPSAPEWMSILIHLVVFFSFTIAWYQVIQLYISTDRTQLLWALGIGIFGAIFIEWGQQFVPYRSMTFLDFITNIVGVLVGVSLRRRIKW